MTASTTWPEFTAAPLLVGVALRAAAPTVVRQCSPAWATRLLVALALVTALATGLVLCSLAVLGVGQVGFAGRLGHWSADVVSDRTRVPTVVGLLAALVVMVLAVRVVAHVVRTTLALRAATATARDLPTTSDGIVIVDDPASTRAYSVPGRPGRIVATSGLLALLDPDERRAVIAHERAHLRHHHAVHIQLAELAAAADPLLRRVADAVRQSVETWADAASVAAVADPMCVVRALAKASLAAGRPSGGVALGMAAQSDGSVRGGALLEPPRRRTRRWLAAAALSTVMCGVGSGVLAVRAHNDIEIAQAWYSLAARAAAHSLP